MRPFLVTVIARYASQGRRWRKSFPRALRRTGLLWEA